MQARGLKLALAGGWPGLAMSRLMQARGLKLLCLVILAAYSIVAPHAGAWIETGGWGERTALGPVAPHAGAWIETAGDAPSPGPDVVAPHAGAWIETVPVVGWIAAAASRASCRRVD